MCGFTGFIDFNKKLDRNNLDKANDVLQHRGPDSGAIAFFQENHASIGLGHRRLSIMDVSSNGSQPMYSDDKSVVIILNGEVYNFKEIRHELVQKGYTFHSDSDTEVIIKAYQQYGIACVHKFIGMFSFALYDMKTQEVYLLRDRAGVKPLYYFHKNDSLLFASELKSIYTYPVFEKVISPKAVSLFFKYGYIRAPFTIFMDTHKLRPGHYLKISLGTKKVEEIKYYDVTEHYNKPKLDISEEEATTEVEKLFTSAFQYRMVSDVPVGVFLSGGYDSGVVTSILQKNNSQKIKTFTIGFNEEKYNEAPHAKKMAAYMGTDHNEYYCTTAEAQDILPTLADVYDEPFGDSSAIPTILVSRFARKHVTVSLSADGGDELFAGYHRHSYLDGISKKLGNSPGILRQLGKNVSNLSSALVPALKKKSSFARLTDILNDSSDQNVADVFSQHYTRPELKALLNGKTRNIGLYDDVPTINDHNDFINRCLALDYKTYMVDDILVKVDRATMSVGLEGREPLLDHRIIEFVAQLPSELKYNNGEKKYLLKKIAHKYIPKELLDRPKTGFGLPVNEWLRKELKGYLYDYINEEQLSKHKLIDIPKALSLRDDFINGKNVAQEKIWLLLMFQMWWNRWM